MNDNDTRSLKDLARNALDVQDACNLSGVVHSFSRDIMRLRALLSEEPDFSTDKLNRHPVSVLYSSKIASLTGSEFIIGAFTNAYKWAHKLV
jgi:hypothetical protein